MTNLPSFEIDHDLLLPGLYTSRADVFGPASITTYDLRIRRPYKDPTLTVEEGHSFEHLLAYYLRQLPEAKKIIYVGPMGCLTGFYVITCCLDYESIHQNLMQACELICEATKMPGDKKAMCGNNRTLNLAAGKNVAREYLNILKSPTIADNPPKL